MAKYVFPAIFNWNETDRIYYVKFPDLPNCFTDGSTVSEALENAADVLNLMLCDRESDNAEIPSPTPLRTVQIPAEGFVNLVAADTDAYREVIARENNPIKYARQKAGLDSKRLAELLGAPYRTVQDWNSGRRMPPAWVQRLVVEKIEMNA